MANGKAGNDNESHENEITKTKGSVLTESSARSSLYFESGSEARSACTIPVTDLGRLRQNPYSQVARLERFCQVCVYVYVGVSGEKVDGSRMTGRETMRFDKKRTGM